MSKKIVVLVAAVMLFLGGSAKAGENRSAPAGEQANAINADYGGVDLAVSSFSILVTTVALPGLPVGAFGTIGSYQTTPSTFVGFPLGTYGYQASTTTPNTKTRWNIYGAYFSSGACSSYDFIDIWQSTGGFVSVNTATPLRIYNVNGSTATGLGANGASCSGITYLRWPIRAYGNLYYRGSNASYNTQGILYWKEQD